MIVTIITGPFGALPPYTIGAVERLWYSIGENLKKKGHIIHYISKRPPCASEIDGNTYIKGYDRTGSWTKDAVLDFFYSIRALLKASKSDIVVLNTIWSPILYKVFKGKFRGSVYNVERFPKKQMFLYNSMDCLSCVSSAVYEELIRQTPKAKDKCCIIPNPIDIEIFKNKNVCRELQKNPVVVYSGRVHKEKGVDILASAVNKLRRSYNVSLKIIGAWDIQRGGSGKEYVDYINSKTEGWSIDWVDPIYSPQELANEINKGDIFCYPSLAEKGETFGVAPLEAMGLGLVPVVSELGCFKDFVVEGVNGLFFNHKIKDNDDILASKIAYLIDNPNVYKEMSKCAIQTSQKFGVETISNKYEILFNEIIDGKTISQKP